MYKNPIALILTVSLSLLVSACGSGTDDQQALLDSSPYKHGREGSVQGVVNYATLINNYTEGKPKREPWAAHWWPYTANGIAAGTDGGSPAGKYDAAHGGTTHAQDWEINHHGSKTPKVEGWWGHCDGWSGAAALYAEPREAVTVNGINFGVADLKALLTEAGSGADYEFFGNKMDSDNTSDPRYDDTVPNQYFSVLTNFMGRNGQVVNIDRYTGYEVWNQPLMGYKMQYPTPADYLGADPSAPGVYRMMFHSTIWWANDSGISSPSVLTPDFNWEDDPADGTIQHRDITGELWLDGPVTFDNGKIVSSGNLIFARDPHTGFVVGGKWHMDDVDMEERWPDYMWLPYSIPRPDMNDPDPSANPWVDIEWIQDHLLVPGGRDDGNFHPIPVPSVPRPDPSSTPTHEPTTLPTDLPTGLPTHEPTTTPTHQPAPEPVPTHTSPFPWPF